ncbi:Bikaverin cluster-transcription factor [Pleurostoma richardsiae]|uniref:Bikaverin cluster-transcription factor n=1 Tax=Pleurostoma richardsiae TaxID=41990 RepID=A0AA38RDU1_9PEZI|nr:Bikaverin cluster-transcription factor [Pleurostoma richardsiae]
MATTAEDPSMHDVKVRTCNLCRQRRVKCDRQLPCCSSCLRSEANCVYPPGRGRAPKRPRRGVEPQLSERLSRLEGIIRQFGAAAQENHQAQEAFQTREASDTHPSFDQDFSRLKIDKSKSYYVSNALWVMLSNEIEELRDLLFEPASEDASYEPAPSPYPSYSPFTNPTTAPSPSSQLGLNAAIFGYRAIASSLHQFHPSLPQAVALFSAFTENVVPLVHIFHVPTLTRVYLDAVAALDSLDKHIEALIFAIHYSSVVSLTPDQCFSILGEMREDALTRYRFCVEQALARGDLLNTQSMTMLQAAVLFLSALPNEDDSRAVGSLTSLIYHIARTMGLHRDGTVFGLKPLETELRRRLWWQICVIDSRSSEYHCNDPIARSFASDTKPPLHVNDVDLSIDMVEPPPERWGEATDMTLSLVRCEAIQTAWKLNLIKQKQPRRPDNSSAQTVDVSRDTDKQSFSLIQDLEARLCNKYLAICNPSVPLQLLCSATARIIIARFWLILRYSAASRKREVDDKVKGNVSRETRFSTGQLETGVREQLFRNSVEILEVSAMLLTNKDVMQWTWYSKTHIQWGAMAFVLSELCAGPGSPESDHAWDCVMAVYDGWKTRENKDDESRLTLWRPIRRLLAKARYVREMQRTEPDRPAQAGKWTQRDGPSPDSPALGYPSDSPPLTHDWTTYTALQQTPSSASMPEPSLSTLSSVSGSKKPFDALQGVPDTEMLDPFMDLLQDWVWTDADDDTASSLAGLNLELPPRL